MKSLVRRQLSVSKVSDDNTLNCLAAVSFVFFFFMRILFLQSDREKKGHQTWLLFVFFPSLPPDPSVISAHHIIDHSFTSSLSCHSSFGFMTFQGCLVYTHACSHSRWAPDYLHPTTERPLIGLFISIALCKCAIMCYWTSTVISWHLTFPGS